MRSLRDKLIKIEGKVARYHGMGTQMAEVAVLSTLFLKILAQIWQLRTSLELARPG
jgi:hypothetical protein